MIELEIPAPLIWMLRWSLFLGPLVLITFLAWRVRDNHRQLVGCLFAFLYGVGTIFATHQLAFLMGWWTYGSNALMLMGIPVDVLLGGAILFGPVLYLSFPKIGPLFLCLPIVIGLHGTVFSSLEPLVYSGNHWFFGVIFVFLIAHIPAIYLARWTSEDRLLPQRAALLAMKFGLLAFLILPTLIMHAMGGSWNLFEIPMWRYLIGLPILGLCFLIGLSSVQMFVIHGDGTPIPLDSTKRLVITGIYAYITNPMQFCSALGWIALGFILGNIWIASASLMAWVFVLGMVRWHHRNDLLVRFPDGWPQYRENVAEWIPRWRPWIPRPASLTYNSKSVAQSKFISFLKKTNPIGLNITAQDGGLFTYKEPKEARTFEQVAGFAKALNHINFFWCLVGAGLLLITLPIKHLSNHRKNLGAGDYARSSS